MKADGKAEGFEDAAAFIKAAGDVLNQAQGKAPMNLGLPGGETITGQSTAPIPNGAALGAPATPNVNSAVPPSVGESPQVLNNSAVAAINKPLSRGPVNTAPQY